MTDNRQLNSELAKSNSLDSSAASEPAMNPAATTVVADSNRRERRRLIRAAVASVPVVLTFTAGKARAQDGSAKDSSENSPAPQNAEVGDNASSSTLGDDDSATGELTPAEKLETFGLQRADRPEGYSDDPFRDLDTVSEPVDLINP